MREKRERSEWEIQRRVKWSTKYEIPRKIGYVNKDQGTAEERRQTRSTSRTTCFWDCTKKKKKILGKQKSMVKEVLTRKQGYNRSFFLRVINFVPCICTFRLPVVLMRRQSYKDSKRIFPRF